MNNIIVMYVVVFLIAFLMTSYMVPRILVVSLRKRLIDKPDKRKIHTVISSRLGGVSFYPSILISICATVSIGAMIDRQLMSGSVSVQFLIASAACLIMYLVGLFDDIAGIRYRKKFVFQILASLMIVSSGLWINDLHGFLGIGQLPWWIGAPFTMFLIVYIMNAINLIDGIDGLCSGLSIVAMGVFATCFIILGDVSQALVAISTAGTLLAFFRYNVRGFSHRSLKIFMGDSGSLAIGTLLSICAIKLTQHRDLPLGESSSLLLAYSVLIIPCFDVLRVMLHRFRIKKNMFLPDKSHIHHKLLAVGFNPRQSLMLILAMSLVFIALNIGMNYFDVPIEMTVLADIVIYTLVNMFITKRIPEDAEFKIAMTERHFATISKRRKRFFFF